MPKRRLLLADDSVTIQKVINLTFADEDMEVITVGDGDAAMRKFVEAVPDLVMADVNMPGVDGYRICEMIKQDEETKNIPVILLVGSFEPFDEAEARRVGADDYLTKPFQSIRQVVNKVSDLLNSKTGEEDFLLPVETAPAGEFEEVSETKATDEFESPDISTENFGDAGMDDEMIQTAQISSSAIEETEAETAEAEEEEEAVEEVAGIEYQSEPIIDPEPVYQLSETVDANSLEPANDSRQALDELDEEDDWAKTPPFSEEDFGETETVSGAKKSAPLLSFDDLDLLEFPQATPKKTSDQRESPAVSKIAENEPETEENDESEITDEPVENSADAKRTENLSPELIEAITDKVVEKISDKVIKRVVREVIAQMEQKK